MSFWVILSNDIFIYRKKSFSSWQLAPLTHINHQNFFDCSWYSFSLSFIFRYFSMNKKLFFVAETKLNLFCLNCKLDINNRFYCQREAKLTKLGWPDWANLWCWFSCNWVTLILWDCRQLLLSGTYINVGSLCSQNWANISKSG
jgi:hypothetical protein